MWEELRKVVCAETELQKRTQKTVSFPFPPGGSHWPRCVLQGCQRLAHGPQPPPCPSAENATERTGVWLFAGRGVDPRLQQQPSFQNRLQNFIHPTPSISPVQWMQNGAERGTLAAHVGCAPNSAWHRGIWGSLVLSGRHLYPCLKPSTSCPQILVTIKEQKFFLEKTQSRLPSVAWFPSILTHKRSPYTPPDLCGGCAVWLPDR